MMTRIIGAAVIFAVSLYTGGACTVLWQKRVEVLSSFCRLLSALEDGISVMGLPMQTIVVPFADSTLEQTGFLPQARRLWERDPATNALRQALDSSGIRRFMEEEETVLLCGFFEALGTEDRVREGSRCTYVHARLRALREDASSVLSVRCRIARTIAGAVGCAAALMLL